MQSKATTPRVIAQTDEDRPLTRKEWRKVDPKVRMLLASFFRRRIRAQMKEAAAAASGDQLIEEIEAKDDEGPLVWWYAGWNEEWDRWDVFPSCNPSETPESAGYGRIVGPCDTQEAIEQSLEEVKP
jgi:hypothetical protein